MQQWLGPAVLIGLALLFVVFAIAAMRKARRRRREQFAEPEAPPSLEEKELEEQALGAPEAEAPDKAVAAAEVERAAAEKAAAEAEAKRAAAEQAAAEAEAQRAAAERAAAEAEAKRAEAERAAAEAKQAAAEAPVVAADAALTAGLERTRSSLMGRFGQLFSRKQAVDPAVLDDLEEVLLTADVGVRLATDLVDDLRGRLAKHDLASGEALRDALKQRLLHGVSVNGGGDPLARPTAKPRVILFVGVNGVGKTTTIGKIAAKLHARGETVVLAAGDTFRAAATEQLQIWAERTGSKLIRGDEGADPASIVFNAVRHAVDTDADVVLADTAGRLHTKTNLMDEIKKVKRAASKARDGAPDETWLVVDATTGQNALLQAREFNQALGVTGVILTKLDGTAKGGVVVAIADSLKLPVRFVGVGEKADDLRPFDPKAFVEALFVAP